MDRSTSVPQTAATTEERLASMENTASGVRELSNLGDRLFALLETGRTVDPASAPTRHARV
jgi:hypothetical protein